MNIYPEQLKQIIAYCEALNTAEEDFQLATIGAGLTIHLAVVVLDEENLMLGRLVDEIGGAWSFEMAK